MKSRITGRNTVKVTKIINAPLQFVYLWCTDYRDDDSKLTGSRSRRIVLEKSRSRAVYVETFMRDGERLSAVNIVSLTQPTRWHLDYVGQDADEVGEYRLRPLGPRKTRLDMTFKIKYKVRNPPTRIEDVKQTSRVWDRYVSSLEKEFRSKAS